MNYDKKRNRKKKVIKDINLSGIKVRSEEYADKRLAEIQQNIMLGVQRPIVVEGYGKNATYRLADWPDR